MNEAQKRKVEANLKTLDYLEGTGVISTHKRKLVNEKFLFISSGGNGHKTLCTLRDQLRWKVDPLELADKTAFLAVDAAYKEMDELEEERGFDSTEVLRLPYEGAHESINPKKISPQMKEWVDPKLYDETGGMASTAASLSGFDNTGAGAWRQPGRVRLCQPNSIEALTTTLTTAIHRLVDDDDKSATRLNVFFLGGLAGGTGSGTMVDLPFLTRQIIRNFSEDLYAKTGVSAYLMLPSACGKEPDSVHKKKGNRNAYAALKEIDYFMGLQGRGEVFHRQYGTFDVEIKENIFDFCTLVEGIADGGVFFGDPAETARKVVANSILNLISAIEEKKSDKPFLVDSFLSNRTPLSDEAVRKQSHLDFPRDANYCYNVIGYSSYVVPIDLMTVYVANKVFDKVWEKFKKCDDADSEAAEQFLGDANLSPRDVKVAPNLRTLRDRFVAHADEVFRRKGPYYMINLMNEIHNVLYADGKFASYAAAKARSIFGTNKEKWQQAERRYKELDEKVVCPMNTGLYEVYTFVIEELQRLLKKNAGLLTDSVEHEKLFHRSFFWSPIDLTSGARATEVVMRYLDDLIPAEEVTRKAKKFVELLCSKKDEWTQLDPPQGKSQAAFDAAKIIRDFIQEEFSQMVNSTMENFLVKLYAGDQNAVVPELSPEEDPNGHKPLETAAQALVNQLSMNASPLLQTRKGFFLSNCVCNKYLTVPDGCKWLDKHIEKYATSRGVVDPGNVYRSSAREEIVLYRLYICVPAWALSWVEQAEKDYESNPHEVGLHMEHGENGRDWSRFPNLFNQALFHRDIPEWGWRERNLAIEAAADLKKAADLKLVVRTNPDANTTAEYALYLPNSGAAAVDLLAAAELNSHKSYTMEELYGILMDKQVLDRPAMRKVDLKYVNQVMTTTDNPAPTDLGERLAESGLRRKMAVWTELKADFPVVEELKQLLEAHNAAATILVNEAERKHTFLDSLAYGLIAYDNRRFCWNKEVGDEKPLSGRLKDRLEQECKEYYAAQAFYALNDDDYEPFIDALTEQEENATDAQLDAYMNTRANMKKYFKKLRALKKESDELGINYPMASLVFENEAGSELATKIRSFYDWMIRQL